MCRRHRQCCAVMRTRRHIMIHGTNTGSMDKRYSRLVLPAFMLGVGLFAAYIAVYRPGYLSNGYYLGGLIFLQILLATLWNYRQRFFLLLVVVFFWAGTSLPFNGVWTAGRWW